MAISIQNVREDDYEVKLDWIVKGLLTEKAAMTRGVIFCRTIYDLEELYTWFKSELKENRFSDPNDKIVRNSYLDMFHGQTSDEVKDIICARVINETTLRVVLCSIAFGMGLDTYDFR
eukprot:Pompholyxophrys_sp_v1_NODE_151_length_1509_cov_1.889959.p1 type:complete len:118 gc:universal NODE_151_length_1509_cov_1.889959:670-317(-)